MQIQSVPIEKPEEINFILGQSHFIKTVEDLHEVMVNTSPGIKFGIAFCEASGHCLVRWSGNDDEMVELAKKNAFNIGAGHSFIIFLKDAYPLNVLNAVKMTNVVCRIFCATANPTDVLIVENERGRGIIGVIDGSRLNGIEDEEGQKWRIDLLRMIGYKVGPKKDE
ncbi:MAG: adenosine-specific kinase [Candidatus Thermoplasmatota archaeon]|nr:adenosine-specific kinase [Candidatus Thermoplasmatota archaeon]